MSKLIKLNTYHTKIILFFPIFVLIENKTFSQNLSIGVEFIPNVSYITNYQKTSIVNYTNKFYDDTFQLKFLPVLSYQTGIILKSSSLLKKNKVISGLYFSRLSGEYKRILIKDPNQYSVFRYICSGFEIPLGIEKTFKKKKIIFNFQGGVNFSYYFYSYLRISDRYQYSHNWVYSYRYDTSNFRGSIRKSVFGSFVQFGFNKIISENSFFQLGICWKNNFLLKSFHLPDLDKFSNSDYNVALSQFGLNFSYNYYLHGKTTKVENKIQTPKRIKNYFNFIINSNPVFKEGFHSDDTALVNYEDNIFYKENYIITTGLGYDLSWQLSKKINIFMGISAVKSSIKYKNEYIFEFLPEHDTSSTIYYLKHIRNIFSVNLAARYQIFNFNNGLSFYIKPGFSYFYYPEIKHYLYDVNPEENWFVHIGKTPVYKENKGVCYSFSVGSEYKIGNDLNLFLDLYGKWYPPGLFDVTYNGFGSKEFFDVKFTHTMFGINLGFGF